MTNGNLSFAYLGLSGFFSISGYLIYKSLLRSNDLYEYFSKRILRIFPAFIVVLTISVIAGSIISSYSLKDYFSQKSTYTYVFHNLLLFFHNPQYVLVDVFNTNPNLAVNGSIWSISYEFFFYVLVSFLYTLRKKKFVVPLIIGIAFFSLFLVNFFYSDYVSIYLNPLFKRDLRLSKIYSVPFTSLLSSAVIRWGLFFTAGCLLASIDLGQYKNKVIPSISFILIVVFARVQFFQLLQYILLPTFVISFGVLKTAGISGLNKKIGDLSYGIYLWGFPIQQVLVFYFKLNYVALMCFSIPISALLGFISWHLIETKALNSPFLYNIRKQIILKRLFLKGNLTQKL